MSTNSQNPHLMKLRKSFMRQTPLLESKIKRDLASFKDTSNKITNEKLSNDTLKGSFAEGSSFHMKTDYLDMKKMIQKELEPYITRINNLTNKVNNLTQQKEKDDAKKQVARQNEEFIYNAITNTYYTTIMKAVDKLVSSKFQDFEEQFSYINNHYITKEEVLAEINRKQNEILKIKENIKSLNKVQYEDGQLLENIKLELETEKEMIEQFKQKIDNKINKDIYPKFVQYSKLEIIEKDIKEAINTLNNTVKDHSKQIRQIRDNSMKRNKLLLSISEDNNNIKTVPNTDRIKVKDVPQKMNKDNNNTNTNDISKIQIFNNTNNTTNYSNEISLLRKEIKEMKKAQSNNTVVDISKNMKDIESVKKIIPMFDQDITKIKKDVLAHEKNFNVIQYNFDNMKKLYDKVLIEFPKIEEIIMIYSKKNTNTEEKIKEIVDHLEQWEKQIVINFNTAFKQYKEVIEQTIKKQNQISPSIEQIEKSTYIENIPQGYSFNNVLAYTNGGEPFSISDNPYIVLQSKKNDISSKSNNKDNNMDITREEEKYLKNYIIPYKENEAVIEINYEQTDRLCHTEEEADVSIVNTNENIHTLYNIKEEYSDSKSDI